MAKVKVLIEFEIETISNSETIEKAIEKGIYYGLDVRRVCMPKEVKKLEIRTYKS